MNLTSFAKKNLIPAIGSSKALIDIFIVILFFENFFITTQDKSLFDISLTFDKIQLAPFLFFFLFIAVTRVFWFISNSIRNTFWYKTDDKRSCIERSSSLSLFILFILTGIYIIVNPIISNNHIPFDTKIHFWIGILYLFFVFMTMVISLLVFILYPPVSKKYYIET